MIQLYFLSILCNGLCGYLLFAGSDEQEIDKSRLSLNNPTVHLVLGILSAVTGVLKLLSPIKYIFFGDLLPAVAGILAGFLLIFGLYRQDTYAMTDSHKSLDSLAANLLKLRKPIGLALLAIALLHFLFSEALFL
jgi:hypothetical protein